MVSSLPIDLRGDRLVSISKMSFVFTLPASSSKQLITAVELNKKASVLKEKDQESL